MSQPLSVLLDTNVLISYLLDRKRTSPATPIVEAALDRQYLLLISDELLQELTTRVLQKPFLRAHIMPADLTGLVTALSTAARVVDLSGFAIPKVVRDADDDYLIALARAGNADVLVTGDRDLLAIADLTPFRILSPRAFADLLAVAPPDFEDR